MIKKILMGVLLAGVSGALIFGAVNRTSLILDKGTGNNSAQLNESHQGNGNQGNGNNANQANLDDSQSKHENDEIGSYARGNNATEAKSGGGQGNGSGNQGNGGQGNGSGEGNLSGTGDAEAVVEDWLILEGTVSNLTSDALIVSLDNGGELLVEGRAWSFAQDSGYTTSVGNSLQLNGFYDGDAFEVGSINDLSSGQFVLLRDESGRPMWAGNGRWN